MVKGKGQRLGAKRATGPQVKGDGLRMRGRRGRVGPKLSVHEVPLAEEINEGFEKLVVAELPDVHGLSSGIEEIIYCKSIIIFIC